MTRPTDIETCRRILEATEGFEVAANAELKRTLEARRLTIEQSAGGRHRAVVLFGVSRREARALATAPLRETVLSAGHREADALASLPDDIAGVGRGVISRWAKESTGSVVTCRYATTRVAVLHRARASYFIDLEAEALLSTDAALPGNTALLGGTALAWVTIGAVLSFWPHVWILFGAATLAGGATWAGTRLMHSVRDRGRPHFVVVELLPGR